MQWVAATFAVVLLLSTVTYAVVSRQQASLAAAALAKANEEADLAKRMAAEKEKAAEDGTRKLIELQAVVASKAEALEKMQSTVEQTKDSKKQLLELRAALVRAQLAAQQADKARRDAIDSLKQSHYKDLSAIEGIRAETLDAYQSKPASKGCFPAGTSIRTADGVAPIESLAPGDVVLAVGPLGEPVFTRVAHVFRTKAPLLIVRTTTGVLRTTADHPLAVQWDRFVRAGDLTLGAFVRRWPQYHQPAEVLQTERLREQVDVYNLEVGDPHTFIADGFVVHNKSGGF